MSVEVWAKFSMSLVTTSFQERAISRLNAAMIAVEVCCLNSFLNEERTFFARSCAETCFSTSFFTWFCWCLVKFSDMLVF